MHVFVASSNTAKIKAVEWGFQKMFPTTSLTLEGHPTPSGVPDQPFGEETFIGAENRLDALKTMTATTPYDYLVALEGGISQFHLDWYVYAAVVIEDQHGRRGRGVSPMYTVPRYIIDEVQAGAELGHVLAKYSGDPDAKKTLGTIGLLSNGLINRDELLGEGVRIALVPFLHPELWTSKKAL